MSDRSSQDENAQAGAGTPECSIFRATYEPSESELTQKAVFDARRKMAVAHEAALRVLGITPTR